MAELKPLAGLVSLSLTQERVVNILWGMNGLCMGCGQGIRGEDSKLCHATVNSSHASIPKYRNTIGILVYCCRCAELISQFLKSLKKPVLNESLNNG